MSETKEDQAQLLRAQMEEINQHQEEENDSTPFSDDVVDDDDIDVLNLPPRRTIHDEKKAKIQWKISFAFVRFFVILFVILVILVLTYSYWGDYFFENSGSASLQVNESVYPLSLREFLSNEIILNKG
ncbi:hypothetical protein ACS127_14585 [Amphibacillus sp. Q70]|uniref:hypothetical protein n=1 Tax=Amphibacillus sp. Q70 TaxID=3453416 RepID=UPI003F8468A1